jgi:hypothetical protein
MALWKDLNNQIHDDMDGQALYIPSWPQGMVQITRAEADAILNSPKTQTQQFKEIEHAFELYMDSVAQNKTYDDRKSCMLYAGYTNPFQTEATAFAQWVASVWVLAVQQQAEVIAGKRAMPTPAQAVSEIPDMVWPQ